MLAHFGVIPSFFGVIILYVIAVTLLYVIAVIRSLANNSMMWGAGDGRWVNVAYSSGVTLYRNEARLLAYLSVY